MISGDFHEKNDRIWELDALRGICILCVILIHLIFDLIYFIGLDLHLPVWYVFVQQYGGVIFVVLSGCCATLGSRSFRRGCIVFSCGMLISLVTFGMYRLGMASRDVIVWFGVLHLLGVCMMLYPVYKKLPTQVLAAVGVVLVVTGYLISGTVVEAKFLFPFGFVYEGFTSSDFFRFCRISAGICLELFSAEQSMRTKNTPARHVPGKRDCEILLLVRPPVSVHLPAPPACRLRPAGTDCSPEMKKKYAPGAALHRARYLIQIKILFENFPQQI